MDSTIMHCMDYALTMIDIFFLHLENPSFGIKKLVVDFHKDRGKEQGRNHISLYQECLCHMIKLTCSTITSL